jgi:rhodanese-related sulfurtransferase
VSTTPAPDIPTRSPALRSADLGHHTSALAEAYLQSSGDEPAYAGSVDPQNAAQILAENSAVLVDVRTTEERKSIGYVPDSVHVAWQTGTAMIKNPRFLKELSAQVPKDAIVLFICRSGKRSAHAAAAAAKAGYIQAFNVLEGVEGDGPAGPGWRDRGLRWISG